MRNSIVFQNNLKFDMQRSRLLLYLRKERHLKMFFTNSNSEKILTITSLFTGNTRPDLRLHIAFSFLKQSFEYVEITEAVGSERDSVLVDRFHNCLIICDRGYIDEELEQRITDSGNLYLIRCKTNTAATVDKAIGDDGLLIHVLKGKTVNKLLFIPVLIWMLPLLQVIKIELLSVTTLTALTMINILS